MLRSYQKGRAKTPAFGGRGGQSFDFFQEGQSIFRIEAHYGDKNNEFLQGTVPSKRPVDSIPLGLIVTLRNGSSQTFGSIKSKGQRTSRLQLQIDEFVKSIEIYHHRYACGGFIIQTNRTVYKMGYPIGNAMPKMEFHNAKLLGVHGGAGNDLDRLGFFYVEYDARFHYPLPFPEQRLMWKSPRSSSAITYTLHRPFAVIEQLDLSLEDGMVVGICSRFPYGTTKKMGKCKETPDVELPLPKRGLLHTVNVLTTPDGFLSGLQFDQQQGDGSVNDKTSKQQSSSFMDVHAEVIGVDIRAPLVGLQCSSNEASRIDALTLLFASPCYCHPLGRLKDVDDADFEDVAYNRLLHSIFAFSNEQNIQGIGFSFTDGIDVIKGEKTPDVYTSVALPEDALYYNLKIKNEIQSNSEYLAGVKFSSDRPSGQSWSAVLGHPIASDADQEMQIQGKPIGVWGAVEDNELSCGLITTSSAMFTTICGRSDGVFYESDCVYSLNRQIVQGSIIGIRTWWNGRDRCIDGFQIQRASSESEASFVTDIGTLNGHSTKHTISENFKILVIEAAISPVYGGRIAGIKVIGRQGTDEKEILMGEMLGSIYRYEFSGVRWIGVYGMIHDHHPVSIGFAFDG